MLTCNAFYLCCCFCDCCTTGGSKSWLEGFYDPNEDQLDNMLYIRYRFNNDMHECLYSDLSEICLPAAEHLIQDSSSGAADADESEYYSEDEDSGRGGDDSEGGLTSGDSMRTPPRHGRRVNNAATTPNSSSSNNRRRRHRSSMAGGLRSSVRVKPRAQVQQEEVRIQTLYIAFLETYIACCEKKNLFKR